MTADRLNDHEVPTTVKNNELVEKRRKQIVIAAVRLFSQKGFYKTTIKELADEAGISHGNIYDYVGSKEDILFLIHEFMCELEEASLRRSLTSGGNSLEHLSRIIRSQFNVMYEWSDTLKLIYRDAHVLKRSLLKKLLQTERGHLSIVENVIREGIKNEKLRPVNVRAVANLIDSMVATWILKRWDLRGHVTRLEMEKTILDMVMQGLLLDRQDRSKAPQNMDSLEGNSILIINSGTHIGGALSDFFLSKGMRLAIQGDHLDEDFPIHPSKQTESVKFYPVAEHGNINGELFNRIENEFGPIDIVIHNLGVSGTGRSTIRRDRSYAAEMLQANWNSALNMASFFQKNPEERSLRRILYIAPWAWDKYLDTVQYDTVKAGVIALVNSLGQKLAKTKINVNCIIPGFIGGIKPLHVEEEEQSEIIDRIPIGHLGEVPDITEAAYFLVSDLSKYTTGQYLEIDGGIN